MAPTSSTPVQSALLLSLLFTLLSATSGSAKSVSAKKDVRHLSPTYNITKHQPAKVQADVSGEVSGSLTSQQNVSSSESNAPSGNVSSTDSEVQQEVAASISATSISGGCANNHCWGASWCDASQTTYNTGLTYECQCPPDFSGIFCTIHNVPYDGCANNQCWGASRCDASERAYDTGLSYICRCPRDFSGIFCTIPKVDACRNCTADQGRYCLPTFMHWSGRFCYDMTNGWARVGTESCGRYDFPCGGHRSSGPKCVSSSVLCDGFQDCPNGSDETTHCPIGKVPIN